MQRALRARTGWANEEKDLMWQEIRRADSEGATLKHAFDVISEKTGRKPNSIRNYYYQSLRDQDAPQELQLMRARPFVPFSEEEIHTLLRSVLADRARGVSVRACVHKMSGGERALALRYQNKYRSILKSHPEMIEQTLAELRAEGLHCSSPYESMRMRKQFRQETLRESSAAPEDAEQLLKALRRMLDGTDRDAQMRHREEIDRMTVRCDLLRLELARREELILQAQSARRSVRAEALALVEACRELLSAQDVELAKARVAERVGALSPLLENDGE